MILATFDGRSAEPGGMSSTDPIFLDISSTATVLIGGRGQENERDRIGLKGHCGKSRALPAVHVSTITYEPGFLLLMDQYVISLMNKYISISTAGTYRRYWRDLGKNCALAKKLPRYVSCLSPPTFSLPPQKKLYLPLPPNGTDNRRPSPLEESFIRTRIPHSENER